MGKARSMSLNLFAPGSATDAKRRYGPEDLCDYRDIRTSKINFGLFIVFRF
jgi:hypothetical protein